MPRDTWASCAADFIGYAITYTLHAFLIAIGATFAFALCIAIIVATFGK